MMTSVLLLLLAQAASEAAVGTPATARQFAREYAECIVKKSPEEAKEAILHAMVDPKLTKVEQRKLLVTGCATSAQRKYPGDSLSFPGYSFYQALADASIAALPQYSAEDLARKAPLLHTNFMAFHEINEKSRISEEKLNELRSAYASDYFYDVYGECLVRTDPAGVRRSLETKVESAEEVRSIRGLVPALQSCLPPGKTLQLDVRLLRPALALNYFRRAHAPNTTEAAE